MREPATLSRRAAAALPLAALIRPAAAAMPAPASPNADAELLDLGRQWETLHLEHMAHWRAWQALPQAEKELKSKQLDAECEAMSFREWALKDRIRAIPATTLAGIAVKAKILAHEKDVEDLDEASIAKALGDAHYAEDRAALSLVLDVLRMARCAS